MKNPAHPRSSMRTLVRFLIVTSAYVLTARLGFRFAFVAEQITTVWAPTGIAVASTILWGRGMWPAIWLGAFIANLDTDAPAFAAAGIAVGNTIEAVVAAAILSRRPSFDPSFRALGDAWAFVGAAVIVAAATSATVGVTVVCAVHAQPWDQFPVLWFEWWLGDALGALVVAPVILTLATTSWSRRMTLETAVAVMTAVVVTQAVFGPWVGSLTAQHPLEYVIFSCAIVAAVRLGQPATALLTLVAGTLAIWYTVRGTGPFAGVAVHPGLVLLQVFTGVLAGTGLLLAAAVTERKTSDRRRAAAYAVGQVLGDAADLTQAAPLLLQGICENLEWPIAAVWTVDQENQRMRCLDIFTTGVREVSSFVEASRSLSVAPGIGLPGRVWAGGGPEWIEDVWVDQNFARRRAAREAGIHGGFAFPVVLDDEVLGVIECFSFSATRSDADLLRAMATVGGQIGQFIGRKRAEEGRERLLELESMAREEAELANRAKDDFLATLSHELRTPLNAIAGWTRILLDGAVDEHKRRHGLKVIERNAHLQAQIVSDILDVSRIVTGGLVLDIKPVDLPMMMTSAVESIRPAAEAKRIDLRLEVHGARRGISCDPQRLQQILWNLLVNAVKFTPAGGVVSLGLDDAGVEGVRLRVSDTGPGITREFLPHVFERFRQADGSVRRQHGGLGLGLAIVRHLTELHGGTVHVENAAQGTGAVFTIVLPDGQAGHSIASPASAPSSSRLPQ